MDDEPVILQLLTEELAKEGHKVETVDRADNVLERIRSETYDLILMDIKLPGMSGIELYKHLQNTHQSVLKRLVFITGDAMGLDTRDFLFETKARCFTKPFDIQQLKRDINTILTEGT